MRRILAFVAALAFIPCALADYCGVIPAGATSRSVYIRILDSTTGLPSASFAYNSSGIDLEYVRAGAAATAITEATQTASGAYSSGGFVSVGKGNYRLDIPDAALATGVPQVQVQGAVTGGIVVACAIDLSPSVNVSSWNGTALATTNPLPNAVPGAAGGVLIAGTNADFDVTANASFSGGVTITQSTSNAAALVVTGNGTGNGATITSGSGATGTGLAVSSAATNGAAVTFAGNGSGNGLTATGGATGHGISGVGGATSGNGIRAAGTAGNSAALNLVGQGSAAGLLSTGGATGAGISAVGGATSGVGLAAAGSNGNSAGATFTGQGTGNGATFTSGAGATGNGVQYTAASTNGSAIGTTKTGTGKIFSTDANVDVISAAGTAWGSGAITAGSIATDAIGAAEIAADAGPELAAATWDLSTTGHTTGGTFGAAMVAAGSAGDPWSTSLPGAYSAGSAGYILGTNLNATVSSRLAPTTAGRTLDVTATGAAGIDWGNVENPTTTVGLTGTTISTTQAVASVSGAVGSVTGAVGSVTGAVGSVTGNVGGNVAGSVGSVASGGITEASFATTAGSFKPLGIIDQGTAQAATATTVQLRSAAAFGDDTLLGATIVACGSTQGYCQSGIITDYVSSTDTATVATWGVTPSGTVTYYVFGTGPSSGGGGGLDAAGVRAAIGLASANLDTQLSTIDDFVDTEVAAIKAKTDFLPSATAGAAGGVFIAGTNAATTVNFTGNLSGSVGSVTGAVGSVTGSVGSVTGAVGSVTGAVGSVTGNVGGTVNGLTSTAQGNVRTAVGLASANLDTQLAGISAPSAATVAAAVWDLSTTGHTTGGTFGAAMNAAGSAGDPWATSLPGAYSAGSAGYILGNNLNAAITSRMATFTLPTNFSSLAITGGGAVTAGTVSDKTGYSLSQAFPTNFSSLSIDGSGRTLLQPTQTGVTIPTVTTLTNAPSDSSGTTTLLSRVSATRAGYLDNLSAGAVAQASALTTAQTDLTTLTGRLTSTRAAYLDNLAQGLLPTAADIWNSIVEPNGSISAKCVLAAGMSYYGGDLTTSGSNSTYKDPSGTSTRITGTVSSPGNRLAAVTCPP